MVLNVIQFSCCTVQKMSLLIHIVVTNKGSTIVCGHWLFFCTSIRQHLLLAQNDLCSLFKYNLYNTRNPDHIVCLINTAAALIASTYNTHYDSFVEPSLLPSYIHFFIHIIRFLHLKRQHWTRLPLGSKGNLIHSRCANVQ